MTSEAVPQIPWYRSIRLRLVGAALAVEIVMLALLLGNSYRLVTEALETQTQARLDALTPLLNSALAGRVFQRDHSEIAAILHQLVEVQPSDLSYLVVLGPRGEQLARAGQVPARLQDEDKVATAASTDLIYDTRIQLTLPGNVRVGAVHFGLSLATLGSLRNAVLRQSLLIAGLEVLFSLLLLTLFGYLLTRPIAHLVAATRRIAAGDYATIIPIEQHDEIGMLAADFNRMITTLAHDIDERNRQQRELEFLAQHDPLTGLPNRALLFDRLSQALANSQRSQRLLALAYLDLDNFKPINDTLGHKVGDQILVAVAQRLKEHVRAGDTVCRLGGDEFVLLLGNLTNIEECTHAIERVLAALSLPYPVDHQPVHLSASVGLSVYPFDDVDPDTLLRHADQAMYIAKQSGRNGFHLFDAAQDRAIQARLSLRSRIETGLARDEFVLFYQPKVDMRSGTVIGAEALIRWQHPEEGLLAPNRFLGDIEHSDLVISLDEWVLNQALTQLEIWQAAGLGMKVSINISPRFLQSPHFAARLAALLKRHERVPAAAIEIEVVESAAIEDVVRAGKIIDACHALGITFALDDFGTGYASLAYFKRLPTDVLKIDQGFVRDLLTDAEDHAIVSGIIGLARSFGRQVIAEGVETAEIGSALLAMGCNLGQGYGIARPMPAAELPGWIATWRPDPSWKI